MSGQRQKMGSERVAVVEACGRQVEVIGCFDKETPEGEYDFYDLYVDGECINLGDPCYRMPTEADARAFLELKEAMA